ncbi:MAG: transglutaminase domain-containing protein, partial [Chloroflexi bacterium]|nr:transglutaminase domain-containing protein [Chloroflexota bacterium]
FKDSLNGWEWGPRRSQPVPANDPFVASTFLDAATTTGRREVRFTVIPDAFRDRTVVAPNTIRSVDRPSDAIVVGRDGWFVSVEADHGSSPYGVTALVPEFRDVSGATTEARLRSAGTAYPAELLALYTALPDRALGPVATAMLSDVLALVDAPANADPDNPYDVARTMETYFQSDRFEYDEDVRDVRNQLCPGDASTVECFAIIRRGYCEYYSSAMTVFLRTAGIPARIAYGFLPGERGTDGLELVPGSAAHWWVEVYFPGVGWIEFDPTGGGRGQPQAIPSGSIGPATPRPSGAALTAPPRPSPATGGIGTPTNQPGTGIGPFIAIGLILAVGVVALALAAIRRVPTKPM